MFHTEALRLQELLAGHGVAVRVGQASVSTDSVRFPLQLGLGTSPRRLLELSGKLAHEAGYSQCHLHREGRKLFLELPREEGAGLRYGDLLHLAGSPPADGALLGLTESGTSLVLHMTQNEMHHLLVTGDAGAGKSELLRVVALGMATHHAPRYWRLALLETDAGGPLVPLRSLPHCWAWSDRPEHAMGWLVRLLTEMVDRERERCAAPRVLAVVDGVDRVIQVGRGVATMALKALLQRGPAVGIHLALASRETKHLGKVMPYIPLQLQGTGLPGRFQLRHQNLDAPVTAARLDRQEAARVVKRLRAERPRVVAKVVKVVEEERSQT